MKTEFRLSESLLTMPANLPRKIRREKSSLNLTLSSTSSPGTTRRPSTNSKNASDRSPWTGSSGVPENSSQSGKEKS